MHVLYCHSSVWTPEQEFYHCLCAPGEIAAYLIPSKSLPANKTNSRLFSELNSLPIMI